ncbi:MAG: inositol monophosphatase [Candidatus Buchananbacteria bacterium]
MAYTNKVLPIIKSAGKELLKYYGKIEASGQKGKLAHSIVTKLDLKTEKYLAASLHKIYPAIDFFGEEYGGNKKAKRFWLVDPIDGTAHFMRGVPFCTTMIALIDSGKVVFSAINNFATGEIFHAEIGRGAKLNNKTIHVSNRQLVDGYLTYEINFDQKKNLDLFLDLREKTMLFKTVTCGYEMGLIAQGKIEGRIALDPYGDDWDYAAGSLLIAEAGGRVINIGKNSYDYKNHNFIMGNTNICREIKKLYHI